MTLLTTVFAAVFCTVLWYQKASARELKVGILCWMFWGASLMWLGDAIFEYAGCGILHPCRIRHAQRPLPGALRDRAGPCDLACDRAH